ncbi:MAG: flagellar export chaperone FliS [Acidimicrobiales bacterium]
MAMTSQALRARYSGEAVATASPARLLTMLYDRLVRDVVAAEQALVDGDGAAAHNQLLHAQAIVTELRTSLDVGAWSGGPALADLYDFVVTELVAANVAKDAARVAACRELLEPLRDAWHEAALESGR